MAEEDYVETGYWFQECYYCGKEYDDISIKIHRIKCKEIRTNHHAIRRTLVDIMDSYFDN